MEAPQRIRYLFGMDTETRAAFAALHTTLREGLDGLREEVTAGLSTLREEMKAGFARTGHFFELQQGQFQDWRKDAWRIRNADGTRRSARADSARLTHGLSASRGDR